MGIDIFICCIAIAAVVISVLRLNTNQDIEEYQSYGLTADLDLFIFGSLIIIAVAFYRAGIF